jgi:hypothetical protein
MDLQRPGCVRPLSNIINPSWYLTVHFRDIFVIWARCKWDNKVRGFLVEKVNHLFIERQLAECKLVTGYQRAVGSTYQE